MTDRDIPQCRRPRRHRLLFSGKFTAHDVVTGDHDFRADILHGPIVEADILHHASVAAAALDPDTDLRLDCGNASGHHVADATRALAADHDRPVSMVNGAISDCDILGWPVYCGVRRHLYRI